MALIYITGISGSGKSTVAEELTERGYNAYDADKVVSAFYRKDTGTKVNWDDVPPEPRTESWSRKHSWRMSRSLVEKLSETAANKSVFLCGVTDNEEEMRDLFKIVFALSINEQTLRHRLATRTSNQFGKQDHELERILFWHKNTEEYFLKIGAIVIDATQPLNEVVNEILEISERVD